MDTNGIDLLRLEVEKIYGKKVLSSADCQQLCIDLCQRTMLRVSFNTLRRVFKLIKDNHTASNYTCEVLAEYCGFGSYNEFIAFKKKSQSSEAGLHDTSLLEFLIRVFKNVEVKNSWDITYFSLVKQTINYLDRHSGIVDLFQREISRTKNGQDFYFEQFINIDQLNDYYGDGLRYYLREKNTTHAQILGNSLLCFRNWMTLNTKGVNKHLDVVSSYNIDIMAPPGICARYFASQVYYIHLLGLDPTPMITKAREFYLFIPSSKYNYSTYFCFEMVISEALLLTGQYEESVFYLDEVLEKIKLNIPSYIDVALLETIYLFKAIAYMNLGKKSAAKVLFNSIDKNKFYFLSRIYLTILYLSLSRKFKAKQVETEQAMKLIEETGFSRLKVLWPSFNTGISVQAVNNN